VLVSEFMLQQTRVATVLPYYERFLGRFPTLERLATASEEAVRAAWSGLGYYRRARNLQATARRLVHDHEGRLPADPDTLRELPGVGPYTAAALASIVHGAPAAVVDGNVIRVLSRLAGWRGSPGSAPARRRIEELAGVLLEPERAGDWNQAVMELGAKVCTPRSPRCAACPWEFACAAAGTGNPERYPEARRARAPLELTRVVGVLRRAHSVLLVRRNHPTLLDGTWEFPGLDLEPGEDPRTALATYLEEILRTRIAVGDEIASVRHSITHRRLHVLGYRTEATPVPRARRGARAWVSEATLGRYPVSSLTAKLLSASDGAR